MYGRLLLELFIGRSGAWLISASVYVQCPQVQDVS